MNTDNITWYERPFPADGFEEPGYPDNYSIEWEWQVISGETSLGKKHIFFADALEELSELTPHFMVDFERRSYSVGDGAIRIRPCHTIFNKRMGPIMSIDTI